MSINGIADQFRINFSPDANEKSSTNESYSADIPFEEQLSRARQTLEVGDSTSVLGSAALEATQRTSQTTHHYTEVEKIQIELLEQFKRKDSPVYKGYVCNCHHDIPGSSPLV